MRAETIALAAVFALATTGVGQDDPAVPKEPDPEVAAQLDEFGKAIRDRKFEQDDAAITIIDSLLSRYESLHPKDQASFVKALGAVFKARKRDPENVRIYNATCKALGRCGALGDSMAAKIIVAAYDKKPFSDEEYTAVQEWMLEAVGETKDEKQIEFLTDRATRDPDDRIKAAAGKALGAFEDADQKVRKDKIVKLLLRNYAKIYGDANANVNPGDPVVETRRRTLNAIAGPWNATLAKLTRQSFQTAPEWQHWWNKSKDDDWDKK